MNHNSCDSGRYLLAGGSNAGVFRLHCNGWVIGLFALMLCGCGGGGGGGPAPAPPGATLTTLAVSPTNSTAVAGTTVQFTATGTYSNGTTRDLTSSVTWASSAQAVATISSAGLASGAGPGAATITATSGAVSGSTELSMTAPMLSGTAAAGLPLVGTVTVKDALGATRTVVLGSNGSYTVDVWGMTAPLVLRAEGNVGSTHYVIHSATAEIGAGGTVNITPLTDLIIANVAGQIASSYFEGGDFAGLSRAQLDEESAALKAKLLPVLLAMEVDASIDLLRTPFTPLASALDAALDIIRVSVDSETHVATITNIVNLISITDDLAVPASQEPGPAALSADGLATAADDLGAIRGVLSDFVALFHTGLPRPEAIVPLLSEDFLDSDADGVDFANDVANYSDLVGGSVTDVTIRRIDYDYNGGDTPLAMVDFTLLGADGVELGRTLGYLVIRDPDGDWHLHGDQREIAIDGHVHLVNDSRTQCRASGFEFGISDDDPANSAGIDHVVVRGPGLPAQGLKYQRAPLGGDWTLVNGAGNPYWYPLTDGCSGWGAVGMADADIAAIPDNALYSVTAYTSASVQVPIGPYGTALTQILPKRPLTLAELNASTRFPTFTTSVPLDGYDGGDLTVHGAGADPARTAWVYLGLNDGEGLLESIDSDVVVADEGTFSRAFTLASPQAVTRREIRVASSDEYERSFMTLANYESFTVSVTVNGLSGSSGNVVLMLNGGAPLTVSSSGQYTFDATLSNAASYVVGVAVQPARQVCGPGVTNGTGHINNANVMNVTLVCTNFSIGGTATGLTGTGLVLQLNGANELSVSPGSSFTFPASTSLGGGILYSIHIQQQPAGQTCTLLKAMGVVTAAAPAITGANAPVLNCLANVTDPLSGTYRAATVDGQPVEAGAFVSFYPDGTYLFGLHQGDPECLDNNGNGVEYGVYNWNEGTDAFAFVNVVLDTNGECGIANDGSTGGPGTLVRNGDGTLSTDTPDTNGSGDRVLVTWAPVGSTDGTLIGSWGNNQLFTVYSVAGVLFSATTLSITQNPASLPGIEHGCYLLSGTTSAGSYTSNFTGTCAVNATLTGVDTTGAPFGHSGYSTVSFTVAADARQWSGTLPNGFVLPPLTETRIVAH